MTAPTQAQSAKPAAPQNLEVIEQGVFGLSIGNPAQPLGRALFTWDTPTGTPTVTDYWYRVLAQDSQGNYTVTARVWQAAEIVIWDPTEDVDHGTVYEGNVTLFDHGAKSAFRLGYMSAAKKLRLELRARAGTVESDSATVDFETKHRPDMYRLTQYVRGALETYTSGRTERDDWVDRFDRYPLYGEQYTTGSTNVLTFLGVNQPRSWDHHFRDTDFSAPVKGSIGSSYNYTSKWEFQDSGLARGGWVHKGVLFTPSNNAVAGDTLALGVTADSWGIQHSGSGLSGNASFAAVQNPTPPQVPAFEAIFTGWTVKPWVLWVSLANYHGSPGDPVYHDRASPMHATGTWINGYYIDVFVAFNTPGIIKYGGTAPYIEIQIDEGDESVTGKAHYVGPYDGSSASSGQRTEIAKFRYAVTAEAASKVDNGWVTVKSGEIVLPTGAYVCRSDLWFIPNNCVNTSFDVSLPVKITQVTQSNVHNGFRYTVTYEQPVKVIGTPHLTATGTSKDGQTTKVVKAKYKSGSETRNLVFEYLLQDDDGLGSEPTFSWGWLPPSRKYLTIAALTNQVPEFMMRFDPWIEELDDGQGNKTMVERNSYILAKRSGQTTYDWDADRRMPANVPSETWTVNRTATASVGEQTQEEVEFVLRGAVVHPAASASAEPSRGLGFPTRYAIDCTDSPHANKSYCASLTFPTSVRVDLDEAVSEEVRANYWGSYVVTETGSVDQWQRRFQRWPDTSRLGFSDGRQRYFVVSGSPIFDLDLWIIYFFKERGMNSVRLAERPFDPPLTVCLPRERAPEHAYTAAWDSEDRRWRVLEPVGSDDPEQICALTPYVTVFSIVVPESTAVLRGAVVHSTTMDGSDPSPSLIFPTRYYANCAASPSSRKAYCGSLTFPTGVLDGLEEAVSEEVRENYWGSYVVTKMRYTAEQRYQRLSTWPDTTQRGFAVEEQRYFVWAGRSIYDLDLWIIYFFEERGMNSVRLAERPFDPPLTVCLPRERAPESARLAVWDNEKRRWQLLELVESEYPGQICALTPYVTEFAIVVPEAISELEQVP